MRRTINSVLFLLSFFVFSVAREPSFAGDRSPAFELSEAHLAATNRPRRLMLHYDYQWASMRNSPWGKKGVDQLDEIIAYYMDPYDQPLTEYVDTVVYELGEGLAVWPSKFHKRAKVVYPKWWAAGIDPTKVLVDETKKRDREVFLTYRLNGTDVEEDAEYAKWKMSEMKRKHRDWVIEAPWGVYVWNFAFKGVRDHKLRILREVASLYDLDALQVDLARTPILFPAGEQWANRHHMTSFMRELRASLLDIGRKRGRPLLLAVRLPENLVGCHFDGIDVERWVDERLIDILMPGCGAWDVDLAAFQRLTKGSHIKIYPSWDPIHPTDGYRTPPMKYWRGFYSKWWAQGADGVHAFNLHPRSPELREIGNPEEMKYKDKAFIVERRSGSHGEKVTGNPDDWRTPRHMYFLTCMLAPLPAPLANDGKADTLLTLTVTDDVNGEADKIEKLTLRMLLSDLKGVETRIEARVNNLLLGTARVEGDWLVFDVQPRQLAVGDNLIGVRLKALPKLRRPQLRIEKLELHVDYRGG